jgi:hypothetical protein
LRIGWYRELDRICFWGPNHGSGRDDSGRLANIGDYFRRKLENALIDFSVDRSAVLNDAQSLLVCQHLGLRSHTPSSGWWRGCDGLRFVVELRLVTGNDGKCGDESHDADARGQK